MQFLKSNKKNRKAAVAGTFYPAQKKKLELDIKSYLKTARQNVNNTDRLQALIVPHAGYMYSGEVAAAAYKQLSHNSQYQRVFVLASSHHYRFSGAALYTQGNYETPFGEINVDCQLGHTLNKSSKLFQIKPEAHEQEHSLEVQLPFLQYLLGKNFKLVPIIIGTNKAEECLEMAKVLKAHFTPENLFVISTDFSHFPNYQDANSVDAITAQSICENSPEQLVNTLNSNNKLGLKHLDTSLCGWTSVLTLLYLTQNTACNYTQLAYKNSGDSKPFGDKKRVVGYWAISLTLPIADFTLNEQEKEELLAKARTSITHFLQTGKRTKIIPSEQGGILDEKCGVFVSIYIKKDLRGCIGAFANEKTLNELVQQMAVSAINDQRFDSITPYELAHLHLEISVLSPLKLIKSENEIELGKHGIYIKSAYNTGTFLPQVADKTNWSVREFLGHCSRDKAGIGWNGWKTAELYTYEALIIRD